MGPDLKARDRTGGAGPLPTTAANATTATRTRPAKGRQIQKTWNNAKVTILCGLVTILVLRGTIGVGNFAGDPQPAAADIDRLLQDLRSDSDPDDPAPLVPSPPVNVTAAIAAVDLKNLTYKLGPDVKDWDERRRGWLRDNPRWVGSERVLLVTGSQPGPCDNPIGDHYLLKAAKNKLDYCRIHGIELAYNMAHLDGELSGYWAKLPLLRRLLLAHPEAEWVWWMDSDALFTDMAFRVPLSKYVGKNLVIHGYPDLLFEQRSWISLNTGSFLLRNTQWALDLIDEWAPMGQKGPVREAAGQLLTAQLKGRPAFEADDQSALIYLLLAGQDKWFPKTFVENSFYLHGFWPGLVERYEEMIERHHPGLGDERWPFVTHFVGCKPCGSYGDYPVEKCLESMERAFNFADNQVLMLYGFAHPSLGSAQIRRVRNESADPLGALAREEARQAAFLSQPN